MSIDPEIFRQMFAAAESQTSDEDDALEPMIHEEVDEPPVRLIEPPIRIEIPPIRIVEAPLSKQEIEAAAAEELLKIAAQEEQDLQDARKALRSKDTFVICCPKGCRIRVKEQHRGRKGKCPRCQSEFVIPKKAVPKNSDEAR